MIIKTKKTRVAGNNSQGEMMVQTAEENKPGLKLRKKVVESYKTNIKPGLKKAVRGAAEDVRDVFSK